MVHLVYCRLTVKDMLITKGQRFWINPIKSKKHLRVIHTGNYFGPVTCCSIFQLHYRSCNTAELIKCTGTGRLYTLTLILWGNGIASRREHTWDISVWQLASITCLCEHCLHRVTFRSPIEIGRATYSRHRCEWALRIYLKNSKFWNPQLWELKAFVNHTTYTWNAGSLKILKKGLFA